MKARAFITLALTVVLIPSLQAQWLPHARPEEVGFSAERLERLHSVIEGYIDRGEHAGAISVVARNGKLVDLKTYGYRDLENHLPMQGDTIVRVYSMSKLITSVAVMQLFEQGRFALEDPVSQFIPELKELQVCTGGTPDQPVLVPAKRPITIKHLLTHTAGFAYDFSAKSPVKELYEKAEILEAGSLQEFITRLAKLPLVNQPGEAFNYGVNIDVLGYLVQVVSGETFEDYMQHHIFDPLHMKDTGFDVPEEKMSRLAKLYEHDPANKKALRPVAKPPYGTYAEKGKGFPSGGGGLFSTAQDYLRFGQMLLNGGKLDGKQLLGRKTVELMTANNLTFLETGRLPGSGSEGFGLGGSVRLDVAKENQLGSLGQFGWDGAATTTFRIDPKERTVALLLCQHLPFNEHGIFARFYTLFYAALVD